MWFFHRFSLILQMNMDAAINPPNNNAAALCVAPDRKAGRPLGFDKSEKLRLRTLVNALFDQGASVYAYPLRLVWRQIEEEELKSCFRCGMPEGIGRVQFLITIPKKRCRHAVDRVRMRRLVREAYRLRRSQLAEALGCNPGIRSLSLAFIFTGTKTEDYKTIDRAVDRLLRKLSKSLIPFADKPQPE